MAKGRLAGPDIDQPDQGSELIQRLKAGDGEALGQLYVKYRDTLIRGISGKLRGQLAAYREDVVNSTFKSFKRIFDAGRVTDLSHRDNLLALLTYIAIRKAINVFTREIKAPREAPLLFQAEAREADPAAEALAKDLYETLINALPSELRGFAILHLEGCTNKEIAAKQTAAGKPCGERTVERKLALIRQEWQELAPRILQG
jgi:hypothetical protein